MKQMNLKISILALGCLAAVGLTSCLGDDDNNENTGLSQQEIGQCLTATKGNYTGKLLFEIENPNDRNDYADTLDIAWSVTSDTMVVINQFPAQPILENIKDNKMKEAMAAAAPTQLKSYMGFYQATSPIGFLLYPLTADFDIEYEGAPHKASLVFWYNTYSFGNYDTLTRVFQMQFMVAALYLDDSTSRNYLQSSGSSTTSIPIVITNADLSK